MVTISQLMTRHLVQIEAGTSAIEAAKLMGTHKVGSVFVTKNQRYIGIVTEPDIVRKVVGAERVPYYIPVEEVMSSPIVGIDEQRPITEAADLMEQHGTRHLAVFREGAVVGILFPPSIIAGAAIGGFYFLKKNIELVRRPDAATAMRCFHASLAQLSLLLAGALLDRALGI